LPTENFREWIGNKLGFGRPPPNDIMPGTERRPISFRMAEGALAVEARVRYEA
jgi:hypothetical protein